MDLTVYEACLLRGLISDRLNVVNSYMRKYKRYTDDTGIDAFYIKLSKLEHEKKSLLRMDNLLSDYIATVSHD